MKKVFILILTLILAFSACAEGLVITATNFPMYSIAKEVVGDKAEVVFAPDETVYQISIGDNVITAKDVAAVYIEGDEYVLTVPVNVMIFACTLGDVLSQADRGNNDFYQANIVELCGRLSELDLAVRDAVTADTVITCDDGSMAYFATEYGVQVGENGIMLHTYSNPGEADAEELYSNLMARNLEALKAEN